VKAFVTGATGFVGSHLAAALVERGDTVVCLARRPEQAAFIASLGALVAPGSLEDGAALAAALRDVEVVYHVAGLTAAASEQEFLAVNEAGTRRLIEAAHRAVPHLQRFVYVSSIAAAGPAPRGGRLAEDAPCRPVTAYGRSKLAGEVVVRRSPALPWTIVRPGVVYGPRDRELLRLFRIARLGVAPVFGLGRQEVSIVHVEDLADAIVRAALEPRALGQTYHVAHPTPVTQRELALAVGRAARGGRAPLILPVPPLLAAPIVRAIGRAAAASGRRSVVDADKLAEFLAPSWAASVEKAQRELGWRASRALAEGLDATAAWYRAEGWLS
jgi:nucleoside-diphosphate-sugar epimerase